MVSHYLKTFIARHCQPTVSLFILHTTVQLVKRKRNGQDGRNPATDFRDMLEYETAKKKKGSWGIRGMTWS